MLEYLIFLLHYLDALSLNLGSGGAMRTKVVDGELVFLQIELFGRVAAQAPDFSCSVVKEPGRIRREGGTNPYRWPAASRFAVSISLAN